MIHWVWPKSIFYKEMFAAYISKAKNSIGKKTVFGKWHLRIICTITIWPIKLISSLQMVDCSHTIKRHLLLGRKAMTNLDSILKSKDVTLPTKVHLSSQSNGFSSSQVWMWELDSKESWAPKNWCFWTVVLEKTLESPLDWKEIQPVHPKGNQSRTFIGRTYAKAEVPILWPPDAKNWLTEKDPDAGKDWRWEEKGMTKDEMVGWHHWFDGPEFE